MRDCPETGPTGVFLGDCGANATLNRSDLLEIKRLITIEKAEACWLLGADAMDLGRPLASARIELFFNTRPSF